MRLAVDGVIAAEQMLGRQAERLDVTVGRRRGRAGATLTIDVDPPFVLEGPTPASWASPSSRWH